MTAPPAETVQRTAEYLRAQSARRTWLDMWPQVLQARLGLIEALRGVTDEQARFKPASDRWSMLEVAAHIEDNTRAVLATIQSLAMGQRVAGGPTVDEWVDPGESTIEALRTRLMQQGVQLSSLVERLPEPAPLEATHPHPWFGEQSCKGWYLFQRVHDLDHTAQVGQIKEAAGYPSA